MKLSVIIPCYNVQRYLPACLDSLLSQSMRDFEAILIDDGSTDDTAKVAKQYASADERIRFIRQQNAGVSAARNAGLRAAQGEWVLFVDADDLLCENALHTMMAYADVSVDMVVSTHETFDESGRVQIVFPETRWMDKTGEACRRAAVLRLIEGDTVLNIMCNKLHRRTLLESEGIRLAEGVRIAEDALFNLEAVLCGKGIAFCDQVTYRYRIHASSATQTRDASEFDVHRPWFSAMSAMLRRRNAFERYYPAYVESVVLRLYKDGGVMGVIREFSKKARAYALAPVVKAKLSAVGWFYRVLCERNLYPLAYPLIFPVELIRRKCREAVFALRVRRK